MSKIFILLFPLLFWQTQLKWEPDLIAAQKKAGEQHKIVLLNFSGSDWCAPCIQLHKNIFSHPDFLSWYDQHLILVNADFPRNKKNRLSTEQQNRNDKMAEQYNPQGIFPLTILLNADGSIRKVWEGQPKVSVAEFIREINNSISQKH